MKRKNCLFIIVGYFECLAYCLYRWREKKTTYMYFCQGDPLKCVATLMYKCTNTVEAKNCCIVDWCKLTVFTIFLRYGCVALFFRKIFTLLKVTVMLRENTLQGHLIGQIRVQNEGQLPWLKSWQVLTFCARRKPTFPCDSQPVCLNRR